MADLSAPLYDGTFSRVSAIIAQSVTVQDFSELVDSTGNILAGAMQLAQSELHGETVANALDIPYNSDQVTRDVNALQARIASDWSAVNGLGYGTTVPKAQADELKSALNAGWGEAYYVYGLVDRLPSFAAELGKITQNFREAPAAFEDLAKGAGSLFDRLAKAFTGQIWPWLIVAGIIMLLIYAGPEVKLAFAALAKKGSG